MNTVKEKIIIAACFMDEIEAYKLWELILNHFTDHPWEDVEEMVFHSYDENALYALRILQAVCLNREQQLEYISREKAIRDHNEMMYEARERGREEGRKEGMEIGENRASLRFNELILLLSRDNRLADLTRSANDPAFQKQLMEEYGIE